MTEKGTLLVYLFFFETIVEGKKAHLRVWRRFTWRELGLESEPEATPTVSHSRIHGNCHIPPIESFLTWGRQKSLTWAKGQVRHQSGSIAWWFKILCQDESRISISFGN